MIAAVKEKIAKEYPGIDLVGAEDGYSKDALPEIASRIAQSGPDLVFAALGFPKQEKLLAILRKQNLSASMMGVGGSFDVFAGAVNEHDLSGRPPGMVLPSFEGTKPDRPDDGFAQIRRGS